MIIECEKCSAKYKIDESKLRAAGSRVRCSRCQHEFTVAASPPADEEDFMRMFGGPEITEETYFFRKAAGDDAKDF